MFKYFKNYILDIYSLKRLALKADIHLYQFKILDDVDAFYKEQKKNDY